MKIRSEFVQRQQTCIAAGGRRVDGEGALDGETRKIMRPARFRPRAGKALAAERLRLYDGANLIAVDIDVSDVDALTDEFGGLIDPAMQSQRQAIGTGVDGIAHLIQPVAIETQHMKNGPENFAPKLAHRPNRKSMRRK